MLSVLIRITLSKETFFCKGSKVKEDVIIKNKTLIKQNKVFIYFIIQNYTNYIKKYIIIRFKINVEYTKCNDQTVEKVILFKKNFYNKIYWRQISFSLNYIYIFILSHFV